MKFKLKIYEIDNGFCRISYKVKNLHDQTIYYCIQDEGDQCGNCIIYRQTSDGEPDYPIKLDFTQVEFEIPTGDSDIEIAVRDFLKTKETDK